MKKKVSIVLGVVLMLILSLSAVPLAVEGQIAEKEVELAQKAAQAWLDRISTLPGQPSEWSCAHLTGPQVYYDLEGEPNAYVFAIGKKGTVGHIVVGSSAYGYPVFEAGEAAPPSVPSADKVKSILERDLALKVERQDIGEPARLLYLGFDHLYAIYEIEQQIVAVNQIFEFRYVDIKFGGPYAVAKRI